MLEKIVSIDKQLFLYLNNLGSEWFDYYWVLATKQTNWTPFFIFLLFLIYKKTNLKSTLIILLFVSVLVIFGDQFTNLIKELVQRTRPCNDLEILHKTRVLYRTITYSYFSGHATNSTAVCVFLFLLFKHKIKYLYFIFLWPAIFAYSRIYIGVHFPLDILSGFFVGTIFGYLFYLVFNKYAQKLTNL